MRFFGFLLLLLAFGARAELELVTQIHDVDRGQATGDETLVLLTSGHVAKLRPGDEDRFNFDRLLAAKSSARPWVALTLDDGRYITGIASVPAPATTTLVPGDPKNFLSTYVPTTVASMEIARQYFREARRTHKPETQCFNRAMVWTYEWWKRHSLRSNKILVFFTRTYIRRYNFEWWFHIAPYVHVRDENGQVVERVLDVKYSSGPRTFREWTNIFVHKDPECPVITKYSDYADYPYVGECYILRTHMYTYQPADLQMYDAWGYRKDAFNMLEVRGAYLEAFDIEL